MNCDVFDEWIALLNAHGATEIAEIAVRVHDDIWTAQKIVEARFGKEASSGQQLVLTVFSAMQTIRNFQAVGVHLSRSEALMLAGAMRGAETRDGPLSEALPAIYKKLGGPE